MNKVNTMKAIFVKAVLLGLFLIQPAFATDLKQIHSRNEAAEQGLLKLRMEEAKVMMADTPSKNALASKKAELDDLVNDIDQYSKSKQANNRKQAITASQQTVEELADVYTRKVYGSGQPKNWRDDPVLVNFAETFETLKSMETHPAKQAALYDQLQEKMDGLDELTDVAVSAIEEAK